MTGVSAIKAETFEIPCKDGLTIRGEVFRAESPHGSVIICHGFKGFAHWAFFPYLARRLAQDGLTAITFDFSGSEIGADRETFTETEVEQRKIRSVRTLPRWGNSNHLHRSRGLECEFTRHLVGDLVSEPLVARECHHLAQARLHRDHELTHGTGDAS